MATRTGAFKLHSIFKLLGDCSDTVLVVSSLYNSRQNMITRTAALSCHTALTSTEGVVCDSLHRSPTGR